MPFNKPNFFILGAPKCGTTSMYHWLNQHSRIFFPKIKEPHFFSTDLNEKKRAVKDLATYLSLYTEATENHSILGEASVFYLYSEKAVENIINFNPNARFLVMLRNPVDMVVSLHNQYLYSGNEVFRRLEKAWALQDKRPDGIGITKLTADPHLLQYGKVCKLGEQVNRLLDVVPNDRVFFILLEDIKTNAENQLNNIALFLDISYEPVSFDIQNEAKTINCYALHLVFKYLNRYKKQMGINNIGSGLGGLISRINVRKRHKQPLKSELHNELIGYFEDDVHLLMKLIDKDLSGWLRERKIRF